MILNLETSLFLNLLFLRKNRVRLTSSRFTRMSMTSLAMLPLAPRIITLFIVVSKGRNNAVDVTFYIQIAISQFSVFAFISLGKYNAYEAASAASSMASEE